MGLDLIEIRRRLARDGLEDRRHPFTESRVRHAHHDGIDDRGVGLQHRFDLLGIDLLAARVDAHGPPPEEADGAVGLDGGHVAGDVASGLFPHAGQNELAHVVRPEGNGTEHPLELFHRGFCHRCSPVGDSGVVDQDVDVPEVGEHAVDHGAGLVIGGD